MKIMRLGEEPEYLNNPTPPIHRGLGGKIGNLDNVMIRQFPEGKPLARQFEVLEMRGLGDLEKSQNTSSIKLTLFIGGWGGKVGNLDNVMIRQFPEGKPLARQFEVLEMRRLGD